MGEIPRSILVFRNGSMGNTLAAVPALRALHVRYPEIPLTVVVDGLGRELLRFCPWITRLISYEKRGADRHFVAYVRLVMRLRQARPTHAILFKRFFRNGLLAYLSGARTRIGFETGGRAPFLTASTPYEEGVSVVDLNLRLAAMLGAPPVGRHLELWLSPEDEREAARFLELSGIDSPFVIAHYGGKTTSPTFVSQSRFAELLHGCARSMPKVLIAQGYAERHSAETIESSVGNAAVACDLPIRTVAALIKRASGFIGFSSGPAHLSAAMKTPGLVLFRPQPQIEAEIAKWAPPFEQLIAVVPPAGESRESWEEFIADCSQLTHKMLASRGMAK